MGGRGAGSKIGTASRVGTELRPGETPFVEMRGWLKGSKWAVVAKNESGQYIFKGYFNKEDRWVDTKSPEYKSILSEYNIKAAFHKDGSVSVKSGGLYGRAKKYKSKDAFLSDASKKLDGMKNYYQDVQNATKKGVISQVTAENFKSLVRNDYPNALRKMKKSMEKDIKTNAMHIHAAEDMKNRLRNSLKGR